jgi:hypothetical protein
MSRWRTNGKTRGSGACKRTNIAPQEERRSSGKTGARERKDEKTEQNKQTNRSSKERTEADAGAEQDGEAKWQ